MSLTTATVHTRQNEISIIGIGSFRGCQRRSMVAMENAIMKLDIEYKELARSLTGFEESLPSGDRLTVDHPQRAAEVLSVLDQAILFWASSKHHYLFYNSIRLARDCLRTVGSHSILMQALPTSKDYASLFHMVVQSIIKASVRQYRVAEGFLTLLVEINNAVQTALETDQEDLAGQNIAELYCQIFLFLEEFMNLYITKAACRQLNSHNEDFRFSFQKTMNNVMGCAAALRGTSTKHRKTETGQKRQRRSSSEILESRLEQAGTEGAARRHAAQTTLVRQLIWNMRQNREFIENLSIGREKLLDDFLAELQIHLHPADVGTVRELAPSRDGRVPQYTPAALSSAPSRRRILKSQLQTDSQGLQDWFDNNDQVSPFLPDLQLYIQGDGAISLLNWTRMPRSQVVGISGPHIVGVPGRMTSISACYTSLARKKGIPVVSHFCARSLRPTKELGLIALVYSLIRQLIELAPTWLDCDSAWDLSGDRFRRLGGTMASWKEALTILDTLLIFAPPVLFCVIDELDLLEDTTTEEYVRSFVNVLISHTSRRRGSIVGQQDMFPQGGLLKVLFTTAGQSKVLQVALAEHLMIVTDVLQDANGYNHPSPGTDTVMSNS